MADVLDYNLHCHTSRCGHATGEDDEYAFEAFSAGFHQLGFSDHVMLPHASQPGIRGEFVQSEDYFASIHALRKKFEGHMDIFLGFEAEWYGERYADYYRELLREKKIDYLILGQHCFIEEDCFYWYAGLPRETMSKNYARDLIEGMRSGLFTYVAHPDIYISWRGVWDETARNIAKQIATVALEMDLPLELNCAPLRAHPSLMDDRFRLRYPCPMFWEEVAKIGAKVVIGVDAHDPKDFARTDYRYFREFATSKGLNLLLECPLKR